MARGWRCAGPAGGSLALFRSVPRVLRVIACALLAAGLAASVQGCGGAASASASASTSASASASAGGLTPAAARSVFNSYTTAERVALKDHNELLAMSLATGPAEDLVVAAFHIAGFGPLTSYTYGQPAIYVPKLSTFPQWFAAVTTRTPAGGGTPRRVLMVFYRSDSRSTWALEGSAVLASGGPPLNVATSGGYATALPTYDKSLAVSPDVVGAQQAAVVDEGPASASAKVVAAGPQTTGLYAAEAAARRQAAGRHETYQWEMYGVGSPQFALKTANGGALTFYTMDLNTVTRVAGNAPRSAPPIPIPARFRNLMPLHQPPVTGELTTDQTLQYAALVPPGGAQGGKVRVVGTGGGPVRSAAS